MEHVPVLQNDVQKLMDLKKGEVVIDATLGLGGHSELFLKSIGDNGKLTAFEADEKNLEEAKKRLEVYGKQIEYINDNFRSLKNRITGEVDAIFFDLGLSSPHLDEGERGFSFQNEGPLDMRFDKRGKLTAYEVVNGYSEEELMKIFFKYGEEKYSRKIAGRIVERRKEKLFETTTELAEFIKGVVKEGKTHPATQVFQAIRIEVNDELGALKEGLEGAMSRLRAGGRLVVISYHSLEDRIVKQFMRGLEKPEASEDEKIYKNFGDPLVKILTKKPVIPTEEEISSNPRSRSAKLRALKKL